MPPVAPYITDVPEQQTERAPPETLKNAPVTPYSIVPRSESAISADL